MSIINKQQSGFALLIALIVVGVVVSVGLTILDLSIKQVNLSTNSRDSEVAFHAANAGLECAKYWRNKKDEEMEAGDDPIDFKCFGSTVSASPAFYNPSGPDNEAYLYDFEFTWSGRCSKAKILLISSDNGSSGATLSGMNTKIPGYPYGDTKSCEPGGRCAVISVKGYNKVCGDVGAIGTLEREVLLES